LSDWTLEGPAVWRLDTFRVPQGSLHVGSVVVDGSEGHHAVNVIRVRAGDVVRLIDGEGAEALARVESTDRSSATTVVLEVRTHRREGAVELTVCQALLKGRSFDEVVRRCTEIGVSAIVPISCERSIGRVREGSLDARRARWEAVALSAVKQARGVFVPRIGELLTVDEAGRALVDDSDLMLVAWEEERGNGLFQVLEYGKATRIALFVGPEGGLTGSEVDLLKAAGARSVSVGRRILRADWAAAAIAAMMSHHLGGLLP
jgi:16S rRNA (uracil1498-N3)-methyltransferase